MENYRRTLKKRMVEKQANKKYNKILMFEIFIQQENFYGILVE